MTVKDFGITKDGIATKLYTLKNNNLEISVTDFGSTLVSIVVPDRNNKPTDIVLGYDDVSGYETDDGYYFGCNVGRCANRIARGHFVLITQNTILILITGQITFTVVLIHILNVYGQWKIRMILQLLSHLKAHIWIRDFPEP